MITDTRDKIINYINYHGQARIHDLYKSLGISRVAIHKQIKKLLRDNIVVHVGKPPLVFYKFPSERSFKSIQTEDLSEYTQRIINENFLSITADGKLLYGLEGFTYLLNTYQGGKSLTIATKEYATILQEQKKLFSKDGWIDASSKLKNSFEEVFVDRLLYQDMYSYKIFGRTKLAKLVMYAKQGGVRNLIDKITLEAKPVVEKIIKTYSINAIAYIPPTVPRPIQFMDEFALRLNLSLPEIKLAKVIPGDIPIPQKTLSTVEERVINARNSIYLKNIEESSYRNILLIDDVVGSGASFNETARKLKTTNGHKNITAFALVGSLKGYEVIREI